MARAWGKKLDEDGRPLLRPDGGFYWELVETAENGDNSNVMACALAQNLNLEYGESPFFAEWGIPVFDSFETQLPPDIFVEATCARFQPYFLSVYAIRKDTTQNARGRYMWPYLVAVTYNNGELKKVLTG